MHAVLLKVAEGDMIAYLNVYRAWEENNRSAKWCSKNYVNHKSLLRANDIQRWTKLHKSVITS